MVKQVDFASIPELFSRKINVNNNKTHQTATTTPTHSR